MSLFEKSSGEGKVKGELEYFGLGDWWLSTFNEEERSYLEQSYGCGDIGVGVGGDQRLTQGQISYTSRSSVDALTGMIGALRGKPEYLHLVQLIIQEAERGEDGSAIDLHFLYAIALNVTYPLRDRHPDALEMAIDACKRQISIAPQAADMFKKREMSEEEAYRSFGACLPAHEGYTRLLILYEKEKRYSKAIQLAQQAKSQGWAGNWDWRIARCEKKLRK